MFCPVVLMRGLDNEPAAGGCLSRCSTDTSGQGCLGLKGQVLGKSHCMNLSW